MSGPVYYIPGDFASVSAAATALAGALICDDLTFKLKNTYSAGSETFPVTFTALTYGPGGPFTVTFLPDGATSASPTITGSNSTAIIDFNGTSNIIFDGRRDGTGSTPVMTISNTSTSAPAVRFINDATYDKVQYTGITGLNAATSNGVISISTTTGTTGNDYNTIDHCNINAGGGSNVASNMIYALGTSGRENDHNSITNNNISDFFYTGAATTTAGIYVSSYNNTLSIQGNKFFQSQTRTFTNAPQPYAVIYINNTNAGPGGFDISNNTIGGNDANGNGTMTYTGAVSQQMAPIYVWLSAGNTNASTISGNTIYKLSCTTTSSGTGQQGAFTAIYLREGAASISNNIIGTASGAVSATVNTNGLGQTNAIKSDATTNVTIDGNQVANFVATGGTGTNVSITAYGINFTAGNVTVSNNTIGSTALQANHAATTNSSVVAGIIGTASASYSASISGNTIYNLSNNNSGTGTASRVAGILTSSGAQYTITGNTIHDLTTAAQNTGTTTSCAVMGISMSTSNTSALKITGNTIYALKNTSATTATVDGIYFSGSTSTSSEVSRNLVYNLQSGSAAGSFINGIHLNGGAVTAANNMVRLGYDATGTAITNAAIISGIVKETTSNNNIYYNSVYVGATGVASTANNTYAFRRITSPSSGVDNVKNNIFYNARSNASTGGKHYATVLNSGSGATNLAHDYNILYATGTGNVLGNDGASDRADLSAWKLNTVFDDNSASADPQFVDPTNAASPSLYLKTNVATPAESAAAAISGLTDDIAVDNVRTGYPLSGQTNGGGQGPDIGADEGDFISADLVAPTFTYTNIPTQSACGTAQTAVQVTINDAQSGLSLASNKPRMYFRQSSPSGSWSASNFVQGVYVSGTANSSVWSFTLTYSTFGITPVATNAFEYYFVAQDQSSTPNVGYSQSNGTTPVHSPDVAGSTTLTPPNFAFGATGSFSFNSNIPLSGTVYIGTGAGSPVYTSFSAATTGLFAAINTSGLSGDLTVLVQNSEANETGAVALNQWTEYCGSGYKIMVKPAPSVGTAVQTISGAFNSATAGLITFNGITSPDNTSHVIFDGDNGSGRGLDFKNTSVSVGSPSPTIAFTGNARYVTIKNCVIENTDHYTSGRIIYFGASSTGSGGNSNITIDNNYIGNASYQVAIPVYAAAGTVVNHDNQITNNEIVNFAYYSSGGWDGIGIYVLSGNGGNWNISGNHLYFPAASYSIAGYQYFIRFAAGASSTGNIISGNYIGGTAKLAAGSQMTIPVSSGSYDADVSSGIVCNAGSVTISNNTIKNIKLTSGVSNGFVGIYILTSATQATISGNVIGDAANANTIQTNGGSTYGELGFLIGIRSASTATLTISNNQITNLYASGTNTIGGADYIKAIDVFGSGAATITGNKITLCKATGLFNVGTSRLNWGIYFHPSTASSSLTIADNIVGIPAATTSGSNAVSFNTTGIGVTGGSVTGTGNILRNVIYDTQNNIPSSSVNGIYLEANGSSTAVTWNVANNQIYLSNPGSSVTQYLNGIEDDLVYGAGSSINLLHNTVYVTGNMLESAPYYRYPGGSGTNGAVLSLKNNLLINTCSGGTYQVAIDNSGTTANWAANASDYNLLVTNDPNAYVGNWGTTKLTFSGWQSGTYANSDAHSINASAVSGTTASVFSGSPYPGTNKLNPTKLFVDPTDPLTANKFLHISTTDATSYNFVSNAGTAVSVTNDIDNEVRCPNGACPGNASTPDIGSDEFSFIATDAGVTVILPDICAGTQTLQATVKNYGTTSINTVTVNWSVNGVAQTPVSLTGMNLASGASATYNLGSFTFTGGSSYTLAANTSLPNGATDAVTGNDSYSVLAYAGLPATVYVGNVGTGTPKFASFSSLFSTINASGLTQNLTVIVQDATVTEPASTVFLNGTTPCTGGPYSILIKPKDATTTYTVTSTNSTPALIGFNGVANVTIDGSVSGTGQYLKFTNSLNNSTVMALNNGVNNFVVQNCIMDGSANAASSVINATGTTGTNHHITISGNNITGFSTYGIFADGNGNGGNWTVSNNNIYNATTATTANQRAIHFIPGSNAGDNSFTGNWIGGSSAQCGGSPWQNTYVSDGTSFNQVGLNLNVSADVAHPTVVSNNKFHNWYTNETTHGKLLCMNVLAGAVNITNNNFGNPTAINDLRATGSDSDPNHQGAVIGLAISSLCTSPILIEANNFSNMTAGSQYYSEADGILYGGSGAATIRNNFFKNIANASTYDGNPQGNQLYLSIYKSCGIWFQSTGTGHLIENNTIANLGNIGTAPTNNPVVGIYISGPGVADGGTIRNNRISSFYTQANGGNLTGIWLEGNGAWNVNNNFIDLKNSNAAGSYTYRTSIYGIFDNLTTGGTANYYYNTIFIDGSQTTANTTWFYTSACYMRMPAQNWNFNSGSATTTLKNNILINRRSGSFNTYQSHACIYDNNGSPWANFTSNYNFLSSLTSGNAQIAMYNSSSSVFVTGYTITAWRNAGYDVNGTNAIANSGSSSSTQVNPDNLFTDLSISSTHVPDLHIKLTDGISYLFVSHKGTNLASSGITTDFDGDIRATANPSPDMGADEFCVVPSVTSATPTNPTCAGNDGNIALAGFTAGWTYSVSYSKNGNAVVAANYTANGSGVITITGLTAGAFTNLVAGLASGCSSTAYPTSGSVTLTSPPCGPATWEGDVPGSLTDWFNAGNWSTGVVPTTCSDDVLIPTSPIGGNNWPVISNTSAQVGNITVQSGAKVTVSSSRTLSVCGTWNGSTTATTATVDGGGFVVLNGSNAQTLTGKTSFSTLRLNNTNGATMQLNSTVDINTALELQTGTFHTGSGGNNGTLTFKSASTTQAAVLDNFSAGMNGSFDIAGSAGVGTVNVERAYAATSANSYNQHYFGSSVNMPALSQFGSSSSTSGAVTPMANCDETQLQTGSLYGSVMSYNQANGSSCSLAGWYVEAATTQAANGKGYTVAKTGSGVLVLTGKPNLDPNGYPQNNLASGSWLHNSLQNRQMRAGWQLVSNPYIAELDLVNISVDATMDRQVQVWNALTGSYTTYVIGNTAVNQHIYIAPGQAFFVHKTDPGAGGTFTVPGSARTRNTGVAFYQQQVIEQLQLNVINQNTGLEDKSIISFDGNATDQFDATYDAYKMGGSLSRHTLYTLNNGNWMSVNTLQSIAQTSTIDVGFEPGISGNYTMKFEGINSFDPTSYIMLEDKKLNIFYDVRQGDYNYTSDAADDWNRFVLHFTPKAEVTTVDQQCSTLGTINVTQPGTANWTYTLTDNNNTTVSSGTLNETAPLTASVNTGTYTLTLEIGRAHV